MKESDKKFDPEEFRREGYRIVDWLTEYFLSIEKYPVKSVVRPGDIYKKIPAGPPRASESLESIFADFEKIIVPGITHWQHPSFFAYFPANSSVPSLLAEFLTAGLGVNAMLWETSPAATELEEKMMEWLKDILGLPGDFKGVIQDTASTSSLCALILAREKATGLNVNEKGFLSHNNLRIYVSDQAHSSIEKGARIAGYGRENVVVIETDENCRIIPESLRKAIIGDLNRRLVPTCAVATIGTTSSLAIDPVSEIGDICSKFKVWLHLDAAYAGSAAVLPEKRHILKGVEKGDSFVFNPHKWLFTNFDCSAFYVKDSSFLRKVFEIHPEYLKTETDHEAINYRDWGVQLGRRFRALKLWFVIRYYGVDGMQKIIRDQISWGESFAKWVDESEDFELVAPVTLNLVCFRYNPGKGRQELGESKLEKLNKGLMEKLNSSGKLYLTHTRVKGKYCLRFCASQTNTTFEHVGKAWDEIRKAAL